MKSDDLCNLLKWKACHKSCWTKHQISEIHLTGSNCWEASDIQIEIRPKKLIKRITTNFIDWRRIEGLAGEGLLHTSFSVSILYLQINHCWHRGGFAKLIIEIMIRALLNVLFKSYLSPFRAESRMAQQESKNCHGVKTTRLDLSSHLRTSVCFTKINYARYQMLCYQSPKSTSTVKNPITRVYRELNRLQHKNQKLTYTTEDSWSEKRNPHE